MRLLQLSHQSIHKSPFPTTAQHIDSATYDLGWDGLRTTAIPDIIGLPLLGYSLFLINATNSTKVKSFICSMCQHLCPSCMSSITTQPKRYTRLDYGYSLSGHYCPW
ncbi:uncharacterized protein EURHEDRAFT_408394 [Aspergillus ruber CBS 135680]|uniref:Uncharacterized protein n=1 Tax=Aspergillus ruber (strain CBS 135680) TaxID=1388766 RepID=A0A017SSA1_ASPRC|nr:uncharacterized protein EURHEDRAFT_408394 [Aspergillus ruber CBS 135680]EYE99140.1 hypothetical protein EURHEDRAFT_408394 [Aspergillus ruber CBS 135680]